MFIATLPVEYHPLDISPTQNALPLLTFNLLMSDQFALIFFCMTKCNGLVAISKEDHFKYSNPKSIFIRSGDPKFVKPMPICHLNKNTFSVLSQANVNRFLLYLVICIQHE